MLIKPFYSGSTGNCYLVSAADTNILIECGIPVKSIQHSLWNKGYKLSDIAGCLVSHEHSDHVKAASQLAAKGVDIYASAGTIKAARLQGHRIHEVLPMMGVMIGNLYIYPYLVEHDAEQPFAFSVGCQPTHERLLYITDTMFFKYQVSGVTHLMIEANYDPEIIAKNADTGRVDVTRAKRTINTHMSIETTLMTIKGMDKSRLKEVWLLHLSNDNAGDNFKKRVQEITGTEVYVA